ncbi:hypothetical protein [Francisella sp. SYW-9]|uniref:hypothetical protein n=1 Tax=Francisella sp. SYW-9 TaxID=2610888 RepID=UPI00168D13FB|nr:hypothetical protein [Francisella sp. SYW-9]
MKDLDYNEYLFAILHFEAFVKDTDTPLDDAFELYLTKYQKYLKRVMYQRTTHYLTMKQ